MEPKIWKEIDGYEGLYSVSSDGQVFSHISGRCLKPLVTRTGYLRVHLVKDHKIKCMAIHRLVAQAFIPNPDNKPTVNHINEDKTDNRFENLEWATFLEQNIHGTRIERAMAHTDWKRRSAKMDYAAIAAKHNYSDMNRGQMKPVQQFDLDGVFIAQFPGLAAAARKLGISAGGLCKCLKSDEGRSYGGYRWKYA